MKMLYNEFGQMYKAIGLNHALSQHLVRVMKVKKSITHLADFSGNVEGDIILCTFETRQNLMRDEYES